MRLGYPSPVAFGGGGRKLECVKASMMNGCCYDLLISPLERWRLGAARQELLSSLEGTILDLGCGTGVNFPYFPNPSMVVGCEPDPQMRSLAESKKPPGLELISSSAECLELPNDSFDHVVVTLVLCTIEDLATSFAEMRRVLRPGGQLHFLEHGRGQGLAGKLHDVCTPLWSKIAGGCQLDRQPLDLMARHGFEVQQCDTVLSFFNTPFYAGTALCGEGPTEKVGKTFG